MKKLLTLLLAIVAFALPLAAQAACTAGMTVPTTTGSVGTQSHTRYISGIIKHPTQPYSISVSWAINGVHQGSGTVSFGSTSGVVFWAGTECQTLLGEVTPGTGDCAGTVGWESTGDSDRIFSFKDATTFDGNGTLITRWLVNGIKVLEGYNLAGQGANTTYWSYGMSKIRSDGGINSWLRFDGYDVTNGLTTRNTHFMNDCGWW